jgi:hypothetical protein
MLRISTITALVALIGLLGCASLPDKLYRQIGDSEIGKINRIGLMQKYGPPQRIDKMDGHEFWTYVLDLGVQSNTFGHRTRLALLLGSLPLLGQRRLLDIRADLDLLQAFHNQSETSLRTRLINRELS